MYKIKQFFLIGILALALLSACNSNDYKTTDSGLKYKFLKEGAGEKPTPGQVMLLNMAYKDGRDTLLFSSLEHGEPMPMPVDSLWSDDGSLYEILGMMKKGDSVEILITARDFFIKTVMQPMPDTLDGKSIFTFNIGVEDVMSMEDFRAYQMQQFEKSQQEAAERAEEQLKIDEQLIDDYLKENNLTAEKTESGLRYIILKQGNGPKAANGDLAVVDFTGITLDGNMFYTSNRQQAENYGALQDSNPYEPLEFTIGAGQMIRGVDEGVALLNEGSKAKLFVPSPLAYGERGAGADIKPNQVITFEVELLDLKNK